MTNKYEVTILSASRDVLAIIEREGQSEHEVMNTLSKVKFLELDTTGTKNYVNMDFAASFYIKLLNRSNDV